MMTNWNKSRKSHQLVMLTASQSSTQPQRFRSSQISLKWKDKKSLLTDYAVKKKMLSINTVIVIQELKNCVYENNCWILPSYTLIYTMCNNCCASLFFNVHGKHVKTDIWMDMNKGVIFSKNIKRMRRSLGPQNTILILTAWRANRARMHGIGMTVLATEHRTN